MAPFDEIAAARSSAPTGLGALYTATLWHVLAGSAAWPGLNCSRAERAEGGASFRLGGVGDRKIRGRARNVGEDIRASCFARRESLVS